MLHRLARFAGTMVAVIVLLGASERPLTVRSWQALSKDGVHDPVGSALPLLQEPQQALRVLPAAKGGDQVDWVDALRGKQINPRSGLSATAATQALDLDVVMTETGSMAPVKFSHRAHTEWLDCGSCHDDIFKPKVGANARGMLSITLGQGCGRCHNTVAFPWKECGRCHNLPRR